MRICIISMIWEPLNLIRRYISYHKNIGITDFILFIDRDNGSIANELSTIEGVVAFACTDQFMINLGVDVSQRIGKQQRGLVEFGLEIAKEKGIDWITHIDFDELIYPRGDLRTILAAMDNNLYAYRLYEAIPESYVEKGPYDTVRFRRYPDARRRIKLARILTLGRPFLGDDHFRGHKNSKSLIRITDNLIHLRIHSPELKKPESRIVTEDLVLLHFDSVSTANWLRKWSQRKKMVEIHVLGKCRQKQGEIAQKALRRSKRYQNRQFKRLYMMGFWSKFVLRRLKLIDTVRIPKEAFVPMPDIRKDDTPRELISRV